MPNFYKQRTFEPPLTAAPNAVTVSPSGRYVHVARIDDAGGNKLYKLDTDNVYREIPGPGDFERIKWTPDERWVVGVKSTTPIFTRFQFDPDTGVFTAAGTSTTLSATYYEPLRLGGFVLLNTGDPATEAVVVTRGTGGVGNRFFSVYVKTPTSYARHSLGSYNDTAVMVVCAAENSDEFYAILRNTSGIEPMIVVRYRVNLGVTPPTADALADSVASPGVINYTREFNIAVRSRVGPYLAVGKIGTPTSTRTPLVRLLRDDGASIQIIPAEVEAPNNFPRPSLAPPGNGWPAFTGRSDNAFVVFPELATNPMFGAEFSSGDIVQSPEDQVPALGSSGGELGTEFHARIDTSDPTPDGIVTAAISTASPYLRIFVEADSTIASVIAQGIMGESSTELSVGVAGWLEGRGILGTAAAEAEVSTIADILADGLMASVAAVAGVNEDGPDTVFVYLSNAQILLDRDPVTYTTRLGGRSGFLDILGPIASETILASTGTAGAFYATGIMGVANINTTEIDATLAEFSSRGLMGIASVVVLSSSEIVATLDGFGFVGNAEISASYDTLSAEVHARGLIGSVSLSINSPRGAVIQVHGIMGTAYGFANAPIGSTLESRGILGDAAMIGVEPVTAAIDARGRVGRSEIFVGSGNGVVLDTNGLMGDADISLTSWEAIFEDVGPMGDATVLSTVNIRATITTMGPQRLWFVPITGGGPQFRTGIIGGASIDARLSWSSPRSARFFADGIMARAEAIVSSPDTWNISAIGIMGTVALTILPSEILRIEAHGIMGLAEFVNPLGHRADVRAIGLMGRAELETDILSDALFDAIGLMGSAQIQLKKSYRRKNFFTTKPF